MERFERALGKAVVLLAISAVTFAVCDWVLPRLLGPKNETQYQDLSRIFFEPQPYVMVGTAPNDELKAQGFNRLGFRGDIPTKEKPPGEIRVFVFGGSTVLNGTPPLTELIQQKFESVPGSKVRIYNFGVVASVTRMDLARLVFVAGDLHPDIILLYGGGNDIVMSYQGDPRPGYPPNYPAYEHNPLLNLSGGQISWKTIGELILYKSGMVRMIAGDAVSESLVGMEALRKAQKYESPEWSERIADQYLHDIELTATVAKGMGAKTLAVFQPLVYYKDHKTQLEERWAFRELNEHAERVRSRVREYLSKPGDRNGVVWNDLSDEFDGRIEEVFTDGIHIKQEFYPVVAERLTRFLNDALQTQLKGE